MGNIEFERKGDTVPVIDGFFVSCIIFIIFFLFFTLSSVLFWIALCITKKLILPCTIIEEEGFKGDTRG